MMELLLKHLLTYYLRVNVSVLNVKICAKKRVLIYPGGMKNNGITTSIINLLENVDYETYDITLFTNKSKILKF